MKFPVFFLLALIVAVALFIIVTIICKRSFAKSKGSANFATFSQDRVAITLTILIMAALIGVSYFVGYGAAYNSIERGYNEQPAFDPVCFYAEIKEINEATFFVEGIDVNETKYQNQFSFTVYGETILERKGVSITVSDFSVGDMVAITLQRDMPENNPMIIEGIYKMQLLDNQQPSNIETEIDAKNEILGVSLSIKENSLSSTGMTLTVINNGDTDFLFGESYNLEKEIDGKWCQIVYVAKEQDISWELIGYMVSAKESYEFAPIDWEWLFGKLQAGNYRIIKDAYIDGNEDLEKQYLYVEFSL